MKAYDITKIGLILLIIGMLVFMIIKDGKRYPETHASSSPEIIQEMVEQDALMKEVSSLRFKVDSVKSSVYNSDMLLRSMDSNFTEQFNKLQKIRNEKFNPPSATIREQYDVITSAKYREY